VNRRVLTIGLLLLTLILSLGIVPLTGADEPPTQEEVIEAIAAGVEWLADQQHPDGFWPHEWAECAVTAMAIKKLEHHAVDPKWGYDLPSPFHEEYPYKEHIEKGFAWLLENCADTIEIGVQPAGDPDSDGDGIGVYFDGYNTYSSGIALMALCEAVELDRVVERGPLTGWTYEEVARDTMDYLAFGQNDGGLERGGWGYAENQGSGDNSNSGYATLGLGFAEAAWPLGCGFTIPGFVKDELNIWIGTIQDPVDGDADDGGSYYNPAWLPDNPWVNILKTGNLLQQMALVGDTASTGRVLDALDYLQRHWYDANQDPGWNGGAGPASYQATFTTMKGLTSLGQYHEFGDPPIEWQADFQMELLNEQYPDGHWEGCTWGDPVLCTTWALLTLQKVAPPPPVPLDIKPQSCPNPLNVKDKGVLPVAILGTDTFDVTQVDPASVRLEGVAPLRWEMEDVATPFEPFLGKQDCFADCTTDGPDGYLDLTLKFDAQEVIAALGDVEDGDCLVLGLTGNLKEEYHGGPFVGEDVVWIKKKGG
jgi:hypothetical protein